MPKGDSLGEFELCVMLALTHLKPHAYGMTIRQEIEARTGRDLAIGSVYATLSRLEEKGLGALRPVRAATDSRRPGAEVLQAHPGRGTCAVRNRVDAHQHAARLDAAPEVTRGLTPMLSRFHRWIVRMAPRQPDQREWMLADLEDESAARARTFGAAAARHWARRQVFALGRSTAPPPPGKCNRRISETIHEHSERLSGDIVLAFRRLRDAPGFALICTATLALGIGGNTAVFTLIDRVLLKPLPVPRPEELYRLGDTDECCVNSGPAGIVLALLLRSLSAAAEAARPSSPARGLPGQHPRGDDRPAEARLPPRH